MATYVRFSRRGLPVLVRVDAVLAVEAIDHPSSAARTRLHLSASQVVDVDAVVDEVIEALREAIALDVEATIEPTVELLAEPRCWAMPPTRERGDDAST